MGTCLWQIRLARMCGSPERRRNLQVFWLMGEAQRETKLSDMEKEAESTQEEDSPDQVLNLGGVKALLMPIQVFKKLAFPELTGTAYNACSAALLQINLVTVCMISWMIFDIRMENMVFWGEKCHIRTCCRHFLLGHCQGWRCSSKTGTQT